MQYIFFTTIGHSYRFPNLYLFTVVWEFYHKIAYFFLRRRGQYFNISLWL